MVPPSQLAFLRECFGNGGIGGGRAVVSNGYGMAEVPGGIARDGVPLPGVEIKLQPLSQNADEPRREEGIGEILVKTARGVIVGSGGSKAILDGEGWFHTGDLGRWVDDENNGQKRLEVIERLGFTVKLANGEFLTPQMLEGVYEQRCASCIASCVLHARPGDRAATAIVVPREAGKCCADAILEAMRLAASDASLRSWEVPGRVLIDPGPWDETNGCCSAHGKVRRYEIARRNGLMTEESHEAATGATVSSDTESGGDGIISHLVAFLSAASDEEAATSLPSAVLTSKDASSWWASLGGDSISATELIAAAPPGLAVHDVFSLTPWQLRRKAQQQAEEQNPSSSSAFWVREADASSARANREAAAASASLRTLMTRTTTGLACC